MLTRGDDYPIHQTAEPIAFSGTDRNFYDRYFFNGYAPDGSGFFALAFGVYPHLNIADAHFSYVRDGVQYCLHASRILDMERMVIEVGPVTIEVVEPLQTLRITIADAEGISADLLFQGRAFPIQEPRFMHRIGPRVLFDYTRMTQNGHWSGWVAVDGKLDTVAPGTIGTRDRSWGVRPIGSRDAQPHAPAIVPGFFWQWTPLNLPSRSIFFHNNADANGQAFNCRAVVSPDGGDHHSHVETDRASLETKCLPGTRHPGPGQLTIAVPNAAPLEILIEPVGRFQMRGIGYTSPDWGHGMFKGALVVEREDIDLAAADPALPENFHVQLPSRVTVRQGDAPVEKGTGVFEQLILGPYHPMGFTGAVDIAPFPAAAR